MINRRKPHTSIRNRNKRIALLGVGGLLLIGLFILFSFWIDSLKSICDKQTRIIDMDTDVVIETGEMVPAEAIHFFFGLTNGALLANIDFASRREAFLKKVPNVRNMRIERRLPNRVTITIEERRPIACLLPPGRKNRPDGRVVDTECVVFQHRRSAAALPVIRDNGLKPTELGGVLKGMQAAAVELITVLSDSLSLSLKVLDVDTSAKDYLLVTLDDYSNVKLAWEKMGENTFASKKSLQMQLTKLDQVIQTHLTPGTVLWNATNWKQNRIYASGPTAVRSDNP